LIRIETERLWLRPFEAADVDALHALWRLPDVRRYLWDDIEIERATAADVVAATQASFAERGYGLCCVHPRGGGALVGFCGLRDYEDPGGETYAEVLYGLHPDQWRRGFAFEAAVAMLRFGFEVCGLARIDGGIDPPNARSRAVLERLGMTGWRRIELDGLPADYASLSRAAFEAAGHEAARYTLIA
jgi:RimJ/RimL family protein N-acetyltransferase